MVQKLHKKSINYCTKEGIFSDVLKKVLVAPIFKKGDTNNMNYYRLISLLPVFSKIFKKSLTNAQNQM